MTPRVVLDEVVRRPGPPSLNREVIPMLLGSFVHPLRGEVPVVVFRLASAATPGRAVFCRAVDAVGAVTRASNDSHVRNPDAWHDGHRLAPVRAKCGVCEHIEATPMLAIQRRIAETSRSMSAQFRSLATAIQVASEHVAPG